MGRIFTTAPSAWEADHARAIVAGLRHQADHDDALPSTPAWRALERRHDLDPARFDRRHPNVGPMIERAELAALRSDAAACVRVGPAPPEVAGVPEPPSAWLLGAGLAAALAWSWLGRPGTAAESARRHRSWCEAYRDNDPLL